MAQDKRTGPNAGVSPILEGEFRLVKVRGRLENTFRDLDLVHDEISICAGAARSGGMPELANVLRASNKMNWPETANISTHNRFEERFVNAGAVSRSAHAAVGTDAAGRSRALDDPASLSQSTAVFGASLGQFGADTLRVQPVTVWLRVVARSL